MTMRPSTTISTKKFSNTIDSIKKVGKNTLASLTLSTKLLTSAVAVSAIGLTTFTGCEYGYNKELLDTKTIYNSEYTYEKYLTSGTYEVEVYGGSDGDIVIYEEIKKEIGNYIEIERKKDPIDKGWIGESEKITFTIDTPITLKLDIYNSGDYIDLKLYKIKD